MDVFAYETVTSTLPKRSFQEMALLNLMVTSGAYSSIHSMCAHSTEIISDVDLVLTSLEYYNEDNLVVQNDFYKDLD